MSYAVTDVKCLERTKLAKNSDHDEEQRHDAGLKENSLARIKNSDHYAVAFQHPSSAQPLDGEVGSVPLKTSKNPYQQKKNKGKRVLILNLTSNR